MPTVTMKPPLGALRDSLGISTVIAALTAFSPDQVVPEAHSVAQPPGFLDLRAQDVAIDALPIGLAGLEDASSCPRRRSNSSGDSVAR